MEDVKYPEVEVQLSGEDGNSFAIMGRVTRALKSAGVPKEEQDAYVKECMASGSQDELLQVTMRWVEVA